MLVKADSRDKLATEVSIAKCNQCPLWIRLLMILFSKETIKERAPTKKLTPRAERRLAFRAVIDPDRERRPPHARRKERYEQAGS